MTDSHAKANDFQATDMSSPGSGRPPIKDAVPVTPVPLAPDVAAPERGSNPPTPSVPDLWSRSRLVDEVAVLPLVREALYMGIGAGKEVCCDEADCGTREEDWTESDCVSGDGCCCCCC